jgi:hypothetical protein
MKQADRHRPRTGGRKHVAGPSRPLRVVEGSTSAPVGGAARESAPDSRSDTFAALFQAGRN